MYLRREARIVISRQLVIRSIAPDADDRHVAGGERSCLVRAHDGC